MRRSTQHFDDSAGGPRRLMLLLYALVGPVFTTKEVGKGTGLGLAAVHGLVRQSGGFIRAESAPGAGSTFEICCPRAERSAAMPVPPRPRLASGGAEHLLLVEDDPHVREVVARQLRAAGYQVEEASGEREALARVDGPAQA